MKTDYSKQKRSSNDAIWSNIPHMSVTIGALTFDAPVAIKHFGSKSVESAEIERDDAGYIYALPGGKRINSNGVIL